jgi:hypothetical protein
MRKALSDTALVWIVVLLALIVQALLTLGVQVPLVERDGAWRMAARPWTVAALVAVGALAVGLLRFAPGQPERRARVVGWVLAALGIACYFAFDPATAVIVAATGRMVYTRGSPRRAATLPQRAPFVT